LNETDWGIASTRDERPLSEGYGQTIKDNSVQIMISGVFHSISPPHRFSEEQGKAPVQTA
jgi:hypothetical protein